MENSTVVFTFSILDTKHPFGGKFSPKNQNHQFKLKLCTKTNSNIPKSMVVFTFSFIDGKHPFWQTWFKK